MDARYEPSLNASNSTLAPRRHYLEVEHNLIVPYPTPHILHPTCTGVSPLPSWWRREPSWRFEPECWCDSGPAANAPTRLPPSPQSQSPPSSPRRVPQEMDRTADEGGLRITDTADAGDPNAAMVAGARAAHLRPSTSAPVFTSSSKSQLTSSVRHVSPHDGGPRHGSPQHGSPRDRSPNHGSPRRSPLPPRRRPVSTNGVRSMPACVPGLSQSEPCKRTLPVTRTPLNRECRALGAPASSSIPALADSLDLRWRAPQGQLTKSPSHRGPAVGGLRSSSFA